MCHWAGALTTRASEEAARLQISRMMDEQLAQNQTIDSLRRQVESSNNALQQAQALLRANQEQQSRMPQPNKHPSGAGGLIGNTPFVPPLATPSTGLRTRELHGPDYYHIGSRNICVLCLAGMIWIHQDKNHRDKGTRNICVLCLAGMIWIHQDKNHRDKGTRNICVLCLAGMIWIHQDKNHRDKSSSRWVPPHGGPVVTILIIPVVTFQAVESFRLVEWIPGMLVCNVCSSLVRPRSRNYLRQIWLTQRSIC